MKLIIGINRIKTRVRVSQAEWKFLRKREETRNLSMEEKRGRFSRNGERDYEKRLALWLEREENRGGPVCLEFLSHANGTTQRLVICIICFPFYPFFFPFFPFSPYRPAYVATNVITRLFNANRAHKILRARFHPRGKTARMKKKKKIKYVNSDPYITIQ